MNDLQRFISFIENAILLISNDYYQTQYHNFYALRGRLRNYGRYNGQVFERHSERGFAYELYFQLRKQIDEYRTDNDFFPHHFLQGEIKKMDVHEVLQMFNYQRLGAGFIPDLLFHVPSQNANAFVIEIKAQPELTGAEILYDLDKLSRFLRRFNYQKAIFIAVNISPESIIAVIRDNRNGIVELFTNDRLADCNIIIKEHSGDDTHIYNQTLFQILT